MVVVNGPVEGGHAVDLGCVDGVGSRGRREETLDRGGVEVFGRVGEGSVGGGGRGRHRKKER